MFWIFPLKVQTLDTKTNEVGHKVFSDQHELTDYMFSQFLLPGEYNLKNTIRWQDAGMAYTKTQAETKRPNFEGGYYVKAIKETHRYKVFWGNEKDRVKTGIIIDGVFIPPFYYWYLNYCPIYDEVKKKKRLGDVWDSDLWFFHYVMLCILTGKHVVVVKARQRGYSFKIMALLYWCYSWVQGAVATIGGYMEEFTSKSWRFLEFYRKHINANTAWKRGPVMPKALEWVERTYLVDGGYTGNDSKISATTFQKSPENGVGGGQTIFFYEEAGIAPTLLQTIGYVRPSLERGNKTTGLIIVSGAIGDLDDCQDLKEIFYDPKSHNFLGIKNIWDKKNNTGRECGLFISESYNLEGYMDADGNSLVDEAMKFIRENNDRVRNTKRKDLAQLDISQKPTSPEEAFAQRKQNEFNVEALIRQQERIRLKYKENRWERKPIKCTLYEDDKGKVCMKTTDLPREHEYPINPEWEDKRGVVTIYDLPPEKPTWLTYFAGVDTVEVDVTTTSHSVMSVDIYMRTTKVRYKDGDGKIKIRYEGGKIVATYRGRYDPVEKGNEQAWYLIKMYHAFTYQERSKPNFLNYMKRMGRAEQFLAKESDVPMFKDLNVNTISSSKSAYGFILSPHNQVWSVFKSNVKEYFSQEFSRIEKEDGEIIKIFTGIDRIDDEWLLEEYIQYNEKDNFDRIISSAAAITIGKIYENEYGITTVNEVKEEVKPQQIRQPRQINMLGGGFRTPRPGQLPMKPGKTKYML